MKLVTCKMHQNLTKHGWWVMLVGLISKFVVVFCVLFVALFLFGFLRGNEEDQGVPLTWKLFTDWSRHDDIFQRSGYLPWGAFSSCKAPLWHCATGKPASAESSRRALGVFCQQRGRHWKKCSLYAFPQLCNSLSRKGKCLQLVQSLPSLVG